MGLLDFTVRFSVSFHHLRLLLKMSPALPPRPKAKTTSGPTQEKQEETEQVMQVTSHHLGTGALKENPAKMMPGPEAEELCFLQSSAPVETPVRHPEEHPLRRGQLRPTPRGTLVLQAGSQWGAASRVSPGTTCSRT